MPASYVPQNQRDIFDPRTGALTDVGRRFFEATAGPSGAGGAGQVWSSDGVTAAFRALADIWPSGYLKGVAFSSVSSTVTNATSTYAATGLSGSLTIASGSSVLVLVCQAGVRKTTSDTGVQLKLRRGTTDLLQFADGAGTTGSTATNDVGTVCTAYLDAAPGSTTPSYNTQVASRANSANAIVQATGETSVMLLVEVAA